MRLSLLETVTNFWLLLMLSLSLLLLLSSSSSSSPPLFWLVLELLNSNTYAIFVESKYWFCFGYAVSAKLLIGWCAGSDSVSVANDRPIATPAKWWKKKIKSKSSSQKNQATTKTNYNNDNNNSSLAKYLCALKVQK